MQAATLGPRLGDATSIRTAQDGQHHMIEVDWTGVEHTVLALVTKLLPTALEDVTNLDTASFLNKASSFLNKAFALDMFPKELAVKLDNAIVAPDRDKANGAGQLVFINYHKTGTFLEYDLSKYFASLRHVDLVHKGSLESWQWDVRDYWISRVDAEAADSVITVDSPSTSWEMPRGARGIHFVRDPVALLLSAYRYHGNNVSAENWEGRAATCHMCGETEHSMIFETCGGTCGYLQLLRSVDEHVGIAIEAIHSRKTIGVMLGNFVRWRKNPDVLHITMEHFSADYDAAVNCIIRFWGFEVTPQLTEALREFNIESKLDNPHDTHSIYNNTFLRQELESNARWGNEFRAARVSLQAVFERESQLYGCPLPDLSV